MSTDLFTLTEDHRAIREAIRDLAEHEIAPHAADVDRLQADEAPFRVEAAWMAELNKVSEGQSHTLGAYYRPWK